MSKTYDELQDEVILLRCKLAYHEHVAPVIKSKAKQDKVQLAAELLANEKSHTLSYAGLQHKRLAERNLTETLIRGSSMDEQEQAEMLRTIRNFESELATYWVDEVTEDQMLDVMVDMGVLVADTIDNQLLEQKYSEIKGRR